MGGLKGVRMAQKRGTLHEPKYLVILLLGVVEPTLDSWNGHYRNPSEDFTLSEF